jgi:hypothetical protein
MEPAETAQRDGDAIPRLGQRSPKAGRSLGKVLGKVVEFLLDGILFRGYQ